MNGALDPAGPIAATLAELNLALLAGAAAVFALTMAALAWAWLRHPAWPARWWIGGAGLAVPAAVLVALFAAGLPWLGRAALLPPDALLVGVTGHQWWWELRYPGGIASANELRIPVGRPVVLALTSADVIHGAWVPALAGKVDLLPGRITHLRLQADRPGVWRGPCAEFCGLQHARMTLLVVAEPAADFDAWLARRRAVASAASAPVDALFARHGCTACHAIDGRGATVPGRGPDLGGLAGRRELGAGTLANDAANRARWIASVQRLKPGAAMPSYDERLSAAELAALADWLGTLR